MSPEARYRSAADALAERMKVWKKMAMQAAERGDAIISLKRQEFWEEADEAVLAEFEAAKNALTGAVPLLEV